MRKELQEKIEKMLQGEQKRREVGKEFLRELTEELSSVCRELYGESGQGGRYSEPSEATWLWKEKEGKREYTAVYFRYGTHPGTRESEIPGFYFCESGSAYWGKAIESQKGKDFWWAIRTIVEWLPFLAKEIEEKTTSREKLVEKLREFLGN